MRFFDHIKLYFLIRYNKINLRLLYAVIPKQEPPVIVWSQKRYEYFRTVVNHRPSLCVFLFNFFEIVVFFIPKCLIFIFYIYDAVRNGSGLC